MVDNVDLAGHTEVLNGKPGHLALAQLRGKGASGKDGDAEVSADQVLDGGDIVYL